MPAGLYILPNVVIRNSERKQKHPEKTHDFQKLCSHVYELVERWLQRVEHYSVYKSNKT